MPRKRDEEWIQVQFWGGSKDGETGLFRDVELSTNDPIKLEQKRGETVIGEETYIAGPEQDFVDGGYSRRIARFAGFTPSSGG